MKNNNKGFSLVELIIVIAIMAILVGVMAPQLLKYIEKSNVSADTQLCATIQTAFVTAMADPEVLEATDNSANHISFFMDRNRAQPLGLISGPSVFCDKVNEIVGFDVFDGVEVQNKLKSHPATDDGALYVQNIGGNKVAVWICHSDKSGEKGDYSAVDLQYITKEIIVR